MRIPLIAAVAATLALAACGDSTGSQAAIGAGAGAAAALVTDVNPVAGAAIGAGANVAFCEANPGRC